MFNATSLQDFRCMNPDETQSLQSSITIQPPLVSEQGYDRFLNLYNYAGHNVMGQALKKRTYHDFENKPTIAPKMIFDGVMESIHSLITPPNKVAKLCDSQELAWFCPQDTPTAAESDDENNSIEEEEQSNFLNDLSLSSSSESNYSFESVSGDDEDSDFEIEDKETKPATSKRLPCSDKTIPTTNDTEPVEISAKIEFGKRGNGNQPWETCAPPPKIGKMRKMCVKLKSLSAIARTVQLQIRTEDKDPELHKGKLVLCSDDRCCTKGKDTKKKRSVQCAERLTELVLPAAEISCAKPYSVEVFLKPEWNGLGKNKTRPSFDVFVELVDMSSGKVHELLSFDTELQSHKFESSAKARAIEKASTATKRKTICL